MPVVDCGPWRRRSDRALLVLDRRARRARAAARRGAARRRCRRRSAGSWTMRRAHGHDGAARTSSGSSARPAFHRAMATHTPDLVTELAGIAEGAGVAADELLAYNLLDEEWWYSETLRSKCSALAVPARDGRPGLVAPDDGPAAADGRRPGAAAPPPSRRPRGGGAVVGRVPRAHRVQRRRRRHLRERARDAPPRPPRPARGVRRARRARAARRQRRRPRSCGPSRTPRGSTTRVVDRSGDAVGLECSAGGATESAPGARPFFHANHPLASADVDPAVARDLTQARARGAGRRHSSRAVRPSPSRADARALLSERTAPICVSRADAGGWLTFGAVVTGAGRDGDDGRRARPARRDALDRARARPMTAAERLAAFAVALRHDDVPARVRERAVLHILDAVGCAYAASALGEGVEARAVVEAAGRHRRGRSHRCPRARACERAPRWPTARSCTRSTSTTPTRGRSATSPRSSRRRRSPSPGPTGASGRELVTAYVAGCEAVARLGAAADGEFHRRGFHATGVCGVFGATVAAARLLSLDAVRTTCALGIAGSFAPGLLEFLGDGSSTKRLHAGGAARAGVEAALLAAAGATGPRGRHRRPLRRVRDAPRRSARRGDRGPARRPRIALGVGRDGDQAVSLLPLHARGAGGARDRSIWRRRTWSRSTSAWPTRASA